MPLEKKEVFIPLVSGADTESDPRVPTTGVHITENGEFSVKGTVRKRDALATLYGDADGDGPTPLPSGLTHVAGLDGAVLLYGNGARVTTTPGDSMDTQGGLDILYPVTDLDIDRRFIKIAGTYTTETQNVDFVQSYNPTIGEDYESDFVVSHSKKYSVVGCRSNFVKHTSSQNAYGICCIDAERTGFGYTVGVTADDEFIVGKWDSVNSTATDSYTSGTITNVVVNASVQANYCGEISSLRRAAVTTAGSNSTGIIINIDIDTPEQKAIAYRAISFTGNAQALCQHPWDTTNAQVMSVWGGNTTTSAIYNLSLDTLTDTGITQDSSGNFTITSVGTNAYVWHVSIMKLTSTTGNIIYSHRGRNSNGTQIITYIRPITISGASITFGTARAVTRCLFPTSHPFQDSDGVWYQWYVRQGGRWWHDSARTIDDVTPQNHRVLMKIYDTAATADYATAYPVAIASYSDPWFNTTTAGAPCFMRTYVNNSGDTVRAVPDSILLKEAIQGVATDITAKIVLNTISTDRQDSRPVEYNGLLMIPGALPCIFDGSSVFPMPCVDYCDSIGIYVDNAEINGAWAAAGGTGDYAYSSTYVYYDKHGRTVESAPAPSISATVASTTDRVDVYVAGPPFGYTIGNLNKPRTRIYRTTTDGSLFFSVNSDAASTSTSDELTISDFGSRGLSANSAVGAVFTAQSLYTDSGELENVAPISHRTSEVHQDRYFYVDRYNESTDIYYSKSCPPNRLPGFNEVLTVRCSPTGGRIYALRSFMEKLWILKENAIYVTYGRPLNDAGAGDGYEPPRLVTKEAGVNSIHGAASGPSGLVFINSSDGDVYMISGDEQVQFIGGAVRHYTRKYTYNNVFFAPQDSCVIITSKTVGAPALAYNYKYGAWSTYTGRYALGTLDAFSAPVGSEYGFGSKRVNVILTADYHAFIQEPSSGSKYAKQEAYNLDVTTSWFSLNDVLGYGRFYRWWLMMGKPTKDLDLVMYTAYDYEHNPQWTDEQTYSSADQDSFPLSNFYDINNIDTTGESLKIEVDGSRHKTDAVRLRIRDDNPYERGNVELVGVRMLIGVKPGGTRLGKGRFV